MRKDEEEIGGGEEDICWASTATYVLISFRFVFPAQNILITQVQLTTLQATCPNLNPFSPFPPLHSNKRGRATLKYVSSLSNHLVRKFTLFPISLPHPPCPMDHYLTYLSTLHHVHPHNHSSNLKSLSCP